MVRTEIVTFSALSITPSRAVASGGLGDDPIEVVRNTDITASGGEGVDTCELSGAGRLGTLTIKYFAVGLGGDRFDVSDLFSATMRAGDPCAAGVPLLVKNGSSTLIALDRDGAAGADTAYVLATANHVTPASLKAPIAYPKPAAPCGGARTGGPGSGRHALRLSGRAWRARNLLHFV